jgi:hypothetical protein
VWPAILFFRGYRADFVPFLDGRRDWPSNSGPRGHACRDMLPILPGTWARGRPLLDRHGRDGRGDIRLGRYACRRTPLSLRGICVREGLLLRRGLFDWAALASILGNLRRGKDLDFTRKVRDQGLENHALGLYLSVLGQLHCPGRGEIGSITPNGVFLEPGARRRCPASTRVASWGVW